MADKIENFIFRLTTKEFELLRQNAVRRGLNVSEYIREVAIYENRTTKNKEDFTLKKEFIQEINRLDYEINRVGNNINQIVKDYNSEFYNYADKAKLTVLLNEIIELEKKVIAMEDKLWQ